MTTPHEGTNVTQSEVVSRLGPVTETWTMNNSAIVQTDYLSIEVFSASFELRGQMQDDWAQAVSFLSGFSDINPLNPHGMLSRNSFADDVVFNAVQMVDEAGDINAEALKSLRDLVMQFRAEETRIAQAAQIAQDNAMQSAIEFENLLSQFILNHSPIDSKNPQLILLNSHSYNVSSATGTAYINVGQDLIRDFVQANLQTFDIGDQNQAALSRTLTNVVIKMPVPVYGSVPETLKSFAATVSSSGFAGALGYSSDLESFTMYLLTGGTALAVWFGRPIVTTVRDRSNDWVDKKLRKKFKLDD